MGYSCKWRTLKYLEAKAVSFLTFYDTPSSHVQHTLCVKVVAYKFLVKLILRYASPVWCLYRYIMNGINSAMCSMLGEWQ